MKKITVFLSDDHAVFREGLRLLLEATDEIEVIGEAENGDRTVAETKRLQPDVVLIDIAMPAFNGIEAARIEGRISNLPPVGERQNRALRQKGKHGSPFERRN